MDRLIPAFNQLQDIVATLSIPEGIALPQIVVVGAQSSGKSSVLESLVRRDFLPRGSGIVTRRPLVLRLCHLTEKREPCGVFAHAPERYIYDFDEIRREIETVTRQAAPKEKDISPVPILLNIYSHDVLDITLVDLPGITKVPVGGQPADIETLVRDMILTFIANPNSVILAISAANTDLANSDALKLAREVDPSGERTLGVLTKLDLMDRGTNALDMLMNKVYPLRLGYVGMICRSQQDIINSVKIETHLRAEREFFTKHEVYAGLAARMGAEHLAIRLNQLLTSHLRIKLPELKKRVSDQLLLKQQELQNYGYFDDSHEGKSTLLLVSIQKYCKEYQSCIEGKVFSKDSTEPQGGAFINHIFFTVFRKALGELSPFHGLDDGQIRSVLANSGGLRPSFFISGQTFEMVIRQQLEQFKGPMMMCLDLVYQTLREILEMKVKVAELERFYVLKEELMNVVQKILTRCCDSCRHMLDTLLDIEMSYTNIQHPDFLNCSDAVLAVTAELKPLAPPQRAPAVRPGPKPGFENLSDSVPASGPFGPEVELKVIKRLIESYFGIVSKNVGDLVPKTVVHLLVNESMRVMERELIATLFMPSRFDELLVESGEIAMRRSKCIDELKVLHQLNEVLSKMNFNE